MIMRPQRSLLSRLLGVFFYLLYQPLAWTYDLVAWSVSLGRWKQWVFAVLPELSGLRTLELGHGPGHLQLELARRSQLAFGLDLSPQMGRLARNRLLKTGQPIHLTRASGQQLPYAVSTFDHLVATFPTEYILYSDTLAEARRVLKPGGSFVILPVAWITSRSLFDRAAAWLFRSTGQAGDWDPRFAQAIRSAGFDVQEKRVELLGSALMLLIATKTR
jgi:ubiquinone/menaquinone biosynthesis C-methylase UbiE